MHLGGPPLIARHFRPHDVRFAQGTIFEWAPRRSWRLRLRLLCHLVFLPRLAQHAVGILALVDDAARDLCLIDRLLGKATIQQVADEPWLES